MKLFKYKDFLNESNQDIDSICKKWGIKNYTINEDGSIDVDGNVILSYKKLTKLPLKFRNVSGDFNCSDNQLTSLEGGPQSVSGNFYCSYNQLTSLEGCPQSVGGDFSCSRNQLTSLEGCPKSVGGIFNCDHNQLTSLEGSPKSVGGYFDCFNNQLKDVYGIKEGFRLGGRFNIGNNPVEEIFKLFPEDRYNEVIEFLNEYNVIRDGKVVILQALEMVYDELGIEVPEEIKIEGYEII